MAETAKADPVRALIALAERAVPFLRDEAAKYDDDGSNEPLELARDIESLLASLPSDESALSPANSAFDGGREAALAQQAGAVGEVVAFEFDDCRACVRFTERPPIGTKLYRTPQPAVPEGMILVVRSDLEAVLSQHIPHAIYSVRNLHDRLAAAQHNREGVSHGH